LRSDDPKAFAHACDAGVWDAPDVLLSIATERIMVWSERRPPLPRIAGAKALHTAFESANDVVYAQVVEKLIDAFLAAKGNVTVLSDALIYNLDPRRMKRFDARLREKLAQTLGQSEWDAELGMAGLIPEALLSSRCTKALTGLDTAKSSSDASRDARLLCDNARFLSPGGLASLAQGFSVVLGKRSSKKDDYKYACETFVAALFSCFEPCFWPDDQQISLALAAEAKKWTAEHHKNFLAALAATNSELIDRMRALPTLEALGPLAPRDFRARYETATKRSTPLVLHLPLDVAGAISWLERLAPRGLNRGVPVKASVLCRVTKTLGRPLPTELQDMYAWADGVGALCATRELAELQERLLTIAKGLEREAQGETLDEESLDLRRFDRSALFAVGTDDNGDIFFVATGRSASRLVYRMVHDEACVVKVESGSVGEFIAIQGAAAKATEDDDEMRFSEALTRHRRALLKAALVQGYS